MPPLLYCAYSLSVSLQLLKNMKKQFCGLLYDTGFVHSPDPDHDEANHNSANTKLIKAVLCAGLYPNVAKIVQTRPDRCSSLSILVYTHRSRNRYNYTSAE